MIAGVRRKGRTARWSALGVGAVVLVLVAVLATRQQASMVMANSPLVGRKAPPITAPSFAGRTVSLSSLSGRWVVVNFFAPGATSAGRRNHSSSSSSTPAPRAGARRCSASSTGTRRQTAGPSSPRPAPAGPRSWIRTALSPPPTGWDRSPRSFLVDPSGRVVASIEGAVSSPNSTGGSSRRRPAVSEVAVLATLVGFFVPQAAKTPRPRRSSDTE